MSSRPGFVMETDSTTPSIVMWHGDTIRSEKLPLGSRVVYPSEGSNQSNNMLAMIASALENRSGVEPLKSMLRPGMKLAIAFNDLSTPIPPMQTPDVRQQVIEAVLELAATALIDDVVLIAARGLRRRMTETELIQILGGRIYDSFAPSDLLIQHDAEDRDNIVSIGEAAGNQIELNKHAVDSDLLIFVSINNGTPGQGANGIHAGLSSYQSIRNHGSGQKTDELLVKQGVKIFQIDVTLETDASASKFSFMQKRELEWNWLDRVNALGVFKSLELAPPALRRSMINPLTSSHQVVSIQAGDVESVHKAALESIEREQTVQVDGQTDIVTIGIPSSGPYNVNSTINPLLVAYQGLNYFLNRYKNKPIVREGGVVIMSHPTPWEFHPVHHPSYVDFFEQVLSESKDPDEIFKDNEEKFSTDTWFTHLYRTSHSFHGAHPLLLWQRISESAKHLGDVIIVGGDRKAVKQMGFKAATTMHDALEMAQDTVGSDASLAHLHTPPLLVVDVK